MRAAYARSVARLTIDQAAHRLGVSTSTIRRHIRAGTLRVERAPTPQGFRWVVLVEDEPEPGGDDRHDHGAHDHGGRPAQADGDDRRQELADRVAWLERRVEELVTLLNREQEAVLRLTETQRPALPSPGSDYVPPVHDYLPEQVMTTQGEQPLTSLTPDPSPPAGEGLHPPIPFPIGEELGEMPAPSDTPAAPRATPLSSIGLLSVLHPQEQAQEMPPDPPTRRRWPTWLWLWRWR